MQWIGPIILLVVFELIADYVAKKWSLEGGWWRASMALAAYLVANSFWLFALKNGSGLARGAVIFSVASAVIAVGLGVLLFREEVTMKGYIGLLLGIVAIVLLVTE